jgi:hypothetical protein
MSMAQVGSLSRERRHALVLPREHGAWGLLCIPLFTGAVVGLARGGHVLPVLLLTIAALALFWLRTPLEGWLGTGVVKAQGHEEHALVVRATLMLAVVAAVSLAALLWNGQHPALLLLGAGTAFAFLLQAVLRKISRSARMASQMIGALGLTLTAPAAYYAATAQLDSTALTLWLANWLFAGDQIHFVQLRVHTLRLAGRAQRMRAAARFLCGQLGLAALLAISIRRGWLPTLAAAAFLPVLVRGFIWPLRSPAPLSFRRLGWVEMAHGILFGLLLSAAFTFSR